MDASGGAAGAHSARLVLADGAVGTLTPPDPQTGELPEKDVLGVYKRALKIEPSENRPQ